MILKIPQNNQQNIKILFWIISPKLSQHEFMVTSTAYMARVMKTVKIWIEVRAISFSSITVGPLNPLFWKNSLKFEVLIFRALPLWNLKDGFVWKSRWLTIESPKSVWWRTTRERQVCSHRGQYDSCFQSSFNWLKNLSNEILKNFTDLNSQAVPVRLWYA